MNKGFLLTVILMLYISFFAKAQNISNEGTDFWAVFPTHVPSNNDASGLAKIAVFVTSKSNSEVTVSCGSYSESKVIPANTAIQFDVPRDNAYISNSEANQNLTNRGIHIKVSDGKPKVSAYAHIYGLRRSAASLILPFESLGQTYYAMTYRQTAGGSNYLVLVAVEDDTSIIIHGKDGALIPVTLAKAGDIYEYMPGSTVDITGIYAEIDPQKSLCKRFVAFSGSTVIAIGGCTDSLDPLYQQLYPTASWGKNYGIVPFKDRRYILRILAQENDTKISLNGSSIVLNKGEYFESGIATQSSFISADKLISVAQYSLTQNCSAASGGAIIGDPDMVMLNPIEFNIRAVTVFSSNLEEIQAKYINVLIRTNKTNTFKINNVMPTVTWTPLAGDPTYSYAQILVADNSLTLTADDGFNAIAYGYGRAESYAYSAGTNLSSNNYLTVVNELRNEERPNGCIGQNVDFKVNLPYQPDRITWTLENGTPEVIDNPVPELKTINGQTTYIYRYPVNKVYTETGEYHLEVLARVPNNETNCTSGDLITNYVFNIYALPIADFTIQPNACGNAAVLISDKSYAQTADFAITKWIWDFKDGTSSTDQNPKHQFGTEGKYRVTLTVQAGSGCYSDPVEKEIEIFPVPSAEFKAPAETCINTNFTVQDLSTISNAVSVNTIKSWSWDFGDGSMLSTEQNPVHRYAAAGIYTIKLVITSGHDCVSAEKTWRIKVTDLPKANFSMPDICVTDAVATFINTSLNSSGNAEGLTYLWDFGDHYLTTPNSGQNKSTDQNGSHTYTVAGRYQVTLTITNSNGCIDVKTQEFVLNGAVPKASFEVISNDLLCSNRTVSIRNTSTVDFGKITRIEVYKDVEHQPEVFETFNLPIPDQIDFNYPVFGLPATQDYRIKLVAYSGGKCSDVAVKIITLQAAPILTVDEILPVCEQDGDMIINQFHEVSGITGDGGIYTSDAKGLNPDGTFNPKLAGVGTHNITYTFTATNGCAASITKSITVNQSPSADAGMTTTVLAGGEVRLPAIAGGENLTYSWSPALNLSDSKTLNPVAAPEEDTEYTLTVTANPSGCQTISKIFVKVLQLLTPPNTFTPNGDNVNDVWNIKYLETYPNATVEIFTRNGTKVYSSIGYKNPFDGNFQNEPLPVGVYYFIINPRNGRKTVTGPLTIIR